MTWRELTSAFEEIGGVTLRGHVEESRPCRTSSEEKVWSPFEWWWYYLPASLVAVKLRVSPRRRKQCEQALKVVSETKVSG